MEKNIKLKDTEIVCDDCKCILDKNIDDIYYIENGKKVCEDCIEDYSYCDHCLNYHSNDITFYDYRGYNICEYCLEDDFIICEDCGKVELREDAYYLDNDGVWICEDCRHYNYMYCSNCNSLYNERDMVYNNYIEEYICEACNDEMPGGDYYHRVNSYHDSPRLEFYNTRMDRNSNRYLGIELEIDNGNNRRDLANEIGNVSNECVYMQEDGSLLSGFEIISHPATIEYHTNRLEWKKILELCKQYGFKSHDTNTCGIHVHVSKKSFGQYHDEIELNIAKLTILFERFWDEIVQFTRRDYRLIERWAKKPTYKFYQEDTLSDIVKKSKYSYYDRYSAINLNNHDTVEFRVFRGTLKYNSFIAILQFIDVIMDYCINHSLSNIFNVTSLTSILKLSKYEELNQYLIEREMV